MRKHTTISFEEWEDENPSNVPNNGPVDIFSNNTLDYIAHLSDVPQVILLNKKYEITRGGNVPVKLIGTFDMMFVLQFICKKDDIATTLFVSDNFTSHCINPKKVVLEETYRLYYWDPWVHNSFLEKGNNLLNINARKEAGELFSISFGEFEKVFVGIKMRNFEEIMQRFK